jgi:hypothetical protein
MKRFDRKLAGQPAQIGPRATPDRTPQDSRSIDERYGLEPVFEPGGQSDGADATATGATDTATASCTVECPYCGESFETVLDLSAGSASYIEDCRVCCQPIEFDLQTDSAGRLVELQLRRGD